MLIGPVLLFIDLHSGTEAFIKSVDLLSGTLITYNLWILIALV